MVLPEHFQFGLLHRFWHNRRSLTIGPSNSSTKDLLHEHQ
uniref:Uncharacterized protein n=1 Tax=Pseudomonas aeruginosa TaxID=287 RepID=A0A7S6G614_PSEAI|nr:hypothetical protein [Pseudomonas aeruginosa]QNI17857.1 hypothetical protein [Pseudomonas aeruginosa]UGK55982.1 Hypothetical protein [Pseudomonas aeruginosa]